MGKGWQAERKRDHYYKKAKIDDYRSRAAFKLEQINDRFKIMREGDIVIDLGACPGGWSQIAAEIVGETGRVLAVDIKSIEPIENVEFFRGDVRSEDVQNWLREILDGQYAFAVISDMSPNISGNYSVDHARSMELAETAFEFAQKHLKNGGNMVVKFFDGDMTKAFVDTVKLHFRNVKRYSPKASRSSSSEIYIIAKGYKK